jgi:hypothetical protein
MKNLLTSPLFMFNLTQVGETLLECRKLINFKLVVSRNLKGHNLKQHNLKRHSLKSHSLKSR